MISNLLAERKFGFDVERTLSKRGSFLNEESFSQALIWCSLIPPLSPLNERGQDAGPKGA